MPAFVIDSHTPADLQTHYKQPLENDRIGQWDFFDPRTGKPRTIVLEIESIRLYVADRPKKRRMPDGTTRDEKRNKYEVSFRGQRKTWICAPTCQKQIAGLYGNALRNWIGKRITLYFDPEVMFGKDKVGGVRVQNTAPRTEPTREVIDNPIDAEAAAKIEQARDREPGEEG